MKLKTDACQCRMPAGGIFKTSRFPHNILTGGVCLLKSGVYLRRSLLYSR